MDATVHCRYSGTPFASATSSATGLTSSAPAGPDSAPARPDGLLPRRKPCPQQEERPP
ncbi:hypothetical protein [Arthrobacter sp. U41]|uniref:hypothetical protein n=1 Tax=Arthrobacter sp. U41 TaxID=1849032 RepID=UPI001643524E|nr:hypothetical protein [Arthrobacter sp. U41]